MLQIAGTKRWRIYPPPIELPHRSQPFAAENYRLPATPLAEVDLTTGDLLYLPRGYVHTASTSDTFSVHVTVGVGVFTWIDLAAELLQSLSGTARHRRALPPGFASRPELQRPLQEQLAELIGQLGKDADYERTLASFTGRVRAAQPRIETTFRANVTAIGPATRLKIAAAQDSYTILHDRDSVILEAQGRRILLPGAVELALNAICAGNIFQPQALPGALDLDDKLALVRHLHGIGFLQVARLRAGV